ncbi:MAG TPA: FHA domain-containing protein [Chloroflexia bacterium]|nr:FHA domain-containing protein [Chloroflexia bacterium]
MPSFLIAQRGPEIGKRLDLKDGVTTIGRSNDNDVELNDPYVSRYHAIIKKDGDNYSVIDLGSENPVQIRDTALEPGEPYTLQHRDVVRIGQTVFSFQNEAMLQSRHSERDAAASASAAGAPVAAAPAEVEDAGVTQIFSNVARFKQQSQESASPAPQNVPATNYEEPALSYFQPENTSNPEATMHAPAASSFYPAENVAPEPVDNSAYQPPSNWAQPQSSPVYQQSYQTYNESPSSGAINLDYNAPAPHPQQSSESEQVAPATSTPAYSEQSYNQQPFDPGDAPTVIGTNYAEILRQYKEQAAQRASQAEQPVQPQTYSPSIQDPETDPVGYNRPTITGNVADNNPAYQDHEQETVVGPNYAELLRETAPQAEQESEQTIVASDMRDVPTGNQPYSGGSYGQNYNAYGSYGSYQPATDQPLSQSTGENQPQYNQYGQYGQYGQAQYGQPQYGQQPTGPQAQPQYGQQPTGPQAQPQYGQPQADQQGQQYNQYGQYGQPQYGQSQGQTPYGQYGQPQYGQQPVQPQAGQHDQQQPAGGQPGQPQYGQYGQYGQQQYGQYGQYGQQQYGQYGQPQYGQPQGQTPYGQYGQQEQPAGTTPAQPQAQHQAESAHPQAQPPAEEGDEDAPTAVIRFDKTKE